MNKADSPLLRTGFTRSGLWSSLQTKTVSNDSIQSLKMNEFDLNQNFFLKNCMWLESTGRSFVKYHFLQEWNNLGYGKTPTDESPWAISKLLPMDTPCKILQTVVDESGQELGIAMAIFDEIQKSTLWMARPVGPVDGFDWLLMERFFSDYRAEELECAPIIKEIPWGYEAASTMRIDCDEAIASGRELFNLYQSLGVPFSMAVTTHTIKTEQDVQLMRDVLVSGGSIVSHSHTHAPNWGGGREAACRELQQSQQILKQHLPDWNCLNYAVSPFHQNSIEAVRGLQDAGLKMFVGGIIANDPEFLMARAGQVPFVDGIYSHSQQCMLHGDCYHQDGNSIKTYKQAFDLAKISETFFGYLDHPFSAYQYGWESELERKSAHKEFIEYMKMSKTWFASLEQALDFLSSKQKSKVWVEDVKLKFKRAPGYEQKRLPDFNIRWKGADWKASDWEV